MPENSKQEANARQNKMRDRDTHAHAHEARTHDTEPKCRAAAAGDRGVLPIASPVGRVQGQATRCGGGMGIEVGTQLGPNWGPNRGRPRRCFQPSSPEAQGPCRPGSRVGCTPRQPEPRREVQFTVYGTTQGKQRPLRCGQPRADGRLGSGLGPTATSSSRRRHVADGNLSSTGCIHSARQGECPVVVMILPAPPGGISWHRCREAKLTRPTRNTTHSRAAKSC